MSGVEFLEAITRRGGCQLDERDVFLHQMVPETVIDRVSGKKAAGSREVDEGSGGEEGQDLIYELGR